MSKYTLSQANPLAPEAHEILVAHAEHCTLASPPGSCHFLDKQSLCGDDVWFALLRQDEQVVGCVAVQDHGEGFAELKSMHVLNSHRGQGLAKLLLEGAEHRARAQGAKRMGLETGSDKCAGDAFAAAREFYLGSGFELSQPFRDYTLDPYSVFMIKSL